MECNAKVRSQNAELKSQPRALLNSSVRLLLTSDFSLLTSSFYFSFTLPSRIVRSGTYRRSRKEWLRSLLPVVVPAEGAGQSASSRPRQQQMKSQPAIRLRVPDAWPWCRHLRWRSRDSDQPTSDRKF